MSAKINNGENSGLHPDGSFAHLNSKKTRIAVCIPACNETSIIPVIRSLESCTPIEGVVVCVNINASENADKNIRNTNKKALDELKVFAEKNQLWFDLNVELFQHLPHKKSGVGLARKLAMDKACSLFESISGDEILICLDADCTVSNNYISEINSFFQKNKANKKT